MPKGPLWGGAEGPEDPASSGSEDHSTDDEVSEQWNGTDDSGTVWLEQTRLRGMHAGSGLDKRGQLG